MSDGNTEFDTSVSGRVILAGDGFAEPGSVFGGSVAGDAGASPSGDGGSGGGDDFTFDPARHAGTDKRNADGSYRRKRGRKPGSTSGDKPKARARVRDLDAKASGYAMGLYSIHAMLAVKAGDVWSMEEEEAKRIGAAIANFEQHFPVNVDPKVVAAVQLCGVLAWSYGPRVAVTLQEVKERKRAKQEAA